MVGDVFRGEGHHQFVGAEAADSFTAELSAVVWALTWVASRASRRLCVSGLHC